MNGITDVAIVGAGPYGLSVAAHLRRSGRSVRQFGLPMHLWRANMPRGMFLKSQGFASNLSDPAAALTLAAFCREQLTSRAAQVGKTLQELAEWRPAPARRGRRAATSE